MKKASGKVPSRTIDPLYVKYSILTKAKFVKLVSDIESIANEIYGISFSLAIEVTGFDEPFANAEDLVQELSETEWLKQKEISAGLFTKEKYSPIIKIRLGRPNWAESAGIKVEILQGSTKDKLAARESIKQLLPDYTRKLIIDARFFTYIFCGILTVAGTAFIFSNAPTKNVSTFFLSLLLPLGVALFVSVFVPDMHSKYIVPHMEYVNDKEQTRWGQIKVVFWSLVALAALVVGIIAIA